MNADRLDLAASIPSGAVVAAPGRLELRAGRGGSTTTAVPDALGGRSMPHVVEAALREELRRAGLAGHGASAAPCWRLLRAAPEEHLTLTDVAELVAEAGVARTSGELASATGTPRRPRPDRPGCPRPRPNWCSTPCPSRTPISSTRNPARWWTCTSRPTQSWPWSATPRPSGRTAWRSWCASAAIRRGARRSGSRPTDLGGAGRLRGHSKTHPPFSPLWREPRFTRWRSDLARWRATPAPAADRGVPATRAGMTAEI